MIESNPGSLNLGRARVLAAVYIRNVVRTHHSFFNGARGAS
jgi:hypothetical protein